MTRSHGTHVLVVIENNPYPYDGRARPQVTALLEAGYRVTVCAPAGYGMDAPEEDVGGARVLRYRSPPGGRGALGYAREFSLSLARLAPLVRRVAREDRVDVALVGNPPDALMGLVAPLARRGTGIVFDDRELSPELFEAKYDRRGVIFHALVAMERQAARRADAVLITNASYRDNIAVRAGVEDKRIFVVGNGPDPARIYPVPPRPGLRRGRRHLVLWLGFMSQQDGVPHLIDAAEELVRRRGRDDVAFAIVGPGDVRESIEADVRRRGLEDVIVLPGRVPDDDIRAYISTADVCVGADRRNRMNDRAAMRKVLEYMSVGKPVVQFPLAEMQRLCGDAAVYARDADPLDLAAKIGELLDDPDERRRLGAAAVRRIAEQRLSWPDQVPVLLEAVELARRRGRARAPRDGSAPGQLADQPATGERANLRLGARAAAQGSGEEAVEVMRAT
jgi:glycosyltransferase involved in cell wall biosynthesis